MSHEHSCIWTGCKPAEIWPLPWGVNLFSFPSGYERLLPLAPGKPSVVLNLREVSNSYESRPHIPFSLKKGIPVVAFNHSFVLLFRLLFFFFFNLYKIRYRGIFLFSNFIKCSCQIILTGSSTLRSDLMGNEAEWFFPDILMSFSVLREHQVSHRHCKSWVLPTCFIVQ